MCRNYFVLIKYTYTYIRYMYLVTEYSFFTSCYTLSVLAEFEKSLLLLIYLLLAKDIFVTPLASKNHQDFTKL